MASYSDVKAGLDTVAAIIRDQRARLAQAKTIAAAASTTLAALSTDYADIISTVNAYGTTNASEAVAKTDLAKLTAEFGTLKSVADQIAAANIG